MATDIDVHIGKRLRRRRRLLGLTRQQLALAVDIRFQKIQKYECGANRISAARLFQLAKALETPIDYFYDGLTDDKTEVAAVQNEGIEVFSPKETLDLIQACSRLAEHPNRPFLEELAAEEIAHKRSIRIRGAINFGIDVAARVRTEVVLTWAAFATFFMPPNSPYFFTIVENGYASLSVAGLAIAALAAKLVLFVKARWLKNPMSKIWT